MGKQNDGGNEIGLYLISFLISTGIVSYVLMQNPRIFLGFQGWAGNHPGFKWLTDLLLENHFKTIPQFKQFCVKAASLSVLAFCLIVFALMRMLKGFRVNGNHEKKVRKNWYVFYGSQSRPGY